MEYLRSRKRALQQALRVAGQSGGLGLDDDDDIQAVPLERAEPSTDVTMMRAEVAGRAMKVTFEVDRLHHVIRDLKAVSRELEYRVSNEVWEQVRSSAASLVQALSAETGCYSESQHERAHGLAEKMRQIREHITAEFTDMAAKNHAVQERARMGRRQAQLLASQQTREDTLAEEDGQDTRKLYTKGLDEALVVSDGMHAKLHEVAHRDDVRVLRLQVEELLNRQTVARFFHLFKCQAMKQRHEQQMQALRMTLESNRELSERLAQAAHVHTQAAAALTQQAKGMSVAEKGIEDLKAKAESNADERHKLKTWRKNKVKQMRHIEQTLKEHRLGSTVNADELSASLQEKRDRVQALEQERAAAAAELQLCARKSQANTARVREALLTQRVEKDATHEDLKQLRAAVDRGGISEEERLRLWRSRAAAERRRVAELEEDNHRLRQLIMEQRMLG